MEPITHAEALAHHRDLHKRTGAYRKPGDCAWCDGTQPLPVGTHGWKPGTEAATAELTMDSLTGHGLDIDPRRFPVPVAFGVAITPMRDDDGAWFYSVRISGPNGESFHRDYYNVTAAFAATDLLGIVIDGPVT